MIEDGKIPDVRNEPSDEGNGLTVDHDGEQHRRELAALVEHSPDAIFRFDADKTYVFANRMAERYAGLSAQDMLGKPIDELPIAGDMSPTWSQALDRVLSTGNSTSFEYGSHTSRGERFFEVRLVPEAGEDGAFDTVLAVARDVTKQVQHERRLQESEERWRLLLDFNPDAIVIFVGERLVYGNQAAAKLYRVSDGEDLIGRSIFDFYSAEDYTDVQRRLDKLHAGFALDPHTYRLITADGEVRDVEVFSVPIKYAGKTAVQAVMHDVTDQREYERNLIEARLRAEEVARLKSSIVTNLSHEIRTPLANVLGFNEVLRDHVDEEGVELLDIVAEGVERLMTTLTTVLELARLEGGSVELSPRKTDVAEIVRNAAAEVRPQANRKNIEIRIETEMNQMPSVLDPTAVYQIVSHLVDNAVKFTDEGMVEISVAAEDDDVFIVVQDTGIGMRPDFLPRLFDEFEQESKGLDRDYEGNGLGLAIVKRLVEASGARISVESQPGEGSSFSVCFPRAVAA